MNNTNYRGFVVSDTLCIFCGSLGPFNTIEHIIPESLGNTEDCLVKEGLCDNCQKYFGQNVEKYVLEKTAFGLYRTLYNIPTKKRNKPFFDISIPEKQSGKIPSAHSESDYGIILHPNDNFEKNLLELEVVDEKMYESIIASGNKLKIVVTPLMLINIGRFLGKMAIELIYKKFGAHVHDSQFDPLRKYARRGTTNEIWPILIGNLNPEKENDTDESFTVYRYALFQLETIAPPLGHLHF